MSSYCFKCRKNTENINPRVLKPSNDKRILLSKCAVCSCKKSTFIKKQEASAILSSLDFRTPLSKVLLLGDILF